MDVVLSCAARTAGIGYSAGHQGEMLASNAVICLNLLEAARRKEVGRFLAVSSSCVYPDDAPSPTPELPVLTSLPEVGNDGYGWAKRMAELQATYYANEYGMSVALVRPFNPYGPRYPAEDPHAHVIPALVQRIVEGGDVLTVWGSGSQRRNFLHARDAASLMLAVLVEATSPDPVNIGFEETVSISELVEAILRLTGRRPTVVYDTTKPEGRPVKSADSRRLKALVPGARPTVSLDEGLREMIEWHMRNRSSAGTR
jgi:nucleoside-diphosphate-sugar epimerase